MFHCSIALLWISFLQVSTSSTVTQDPVSLKVHEGDFTTIRCVFDTGAVRLAASAEFFRMPDENNPLSNSSDGRISLLSTSNSLVMTIHRAIICDAGTYVCKVKFFNGEPRRGLGTTLHVIESTSGKGKHSYAQTIVEVIRIILMVVLIILALTLLVKFW